MTLPTPNFTLEQFLAELTKPETPHEGFHSAKEWATILGIPAYRVRQLLHLANEQGKLRHEKHRRTSALTGDGAVISTYAFVLSSGDSTGEQ